jgi:thioredoxin
MKKLILPFVAAAFFAVSCHQSVSTYGSLDAKNFSAKIDSLPDEQIVDVRTPSEYAAGHIANAVNMDWNGNDFKGQAKTLDKTKPVMVYCLSGGRSHEAAEYLKKEGFTTVYELDKGITSWKSANLPLTTPDQNTTQSQPAGEISTAEYRALVNSQAVVLVDFSAVWCGPCRRLAPHLDELEKEMGNKFKLVRLDSDRDAQAADSMNITALPTLILYKNGKVEWRNEGYLEKEDVAEQINKVAN